MSDHENCEFAIKIGYGPQGGLMMTHCSCGHRNDTPLSRDAARSIGRDLLGAADASAAIAASSPELQEPHLGSA